MPLARLPHCSLGILTFSFVAAVEGGFSVGGGVLEEEGVSEPSALLDEQWA